MKDESNGCHSPLCHMASACECGSESSKTAHVLFGKHGVLEKGRVAIRVDRGGLFFADPFGPLNPEGTSTYGWAVKRDQSTGRNFECWGKGVGFNLPCPDLVWVAGVGPQACGQEGLGEFAVPRGPPLAIEQRRSKTPALESSIREEISFSKC